MKIIKRIHGGYQEFIIAKKKGINIRQLGKWQYIYSSDKGEISLVLLKNYGFSGDLWEIFELSGNNLFNGVEKFNTKKEAEKRIKELLK